MEHLINISEYPVKPALKVLLQDKTTKQNIVFATDSYKHLGNRYSAKSPIEPELLYGMEAMDIQPRVLKDETAQTDRTRKRAEVMTPAWLVNRMNNDCDEAWFGYKDVFNKENGETWITKEAHVNFPDGKTWKSYVDARRMEVTCGEAPYLVSRYDTTTGKEIPITARIGLLDRKLRVVGENTKNREEWLKWAIRSAKDGYEYRVGRQSLI